jgi:hypothetical protein
MSFRLDDVCELLLAVALGCAPVGMLIAVLVGPL